MMDRQTYTMAGLLQLSRSIDSRILTGMSKNFRETVVMGRLIELIWFFLQCSSGITKDFDDGSLPMLGDDSSSGIWSDAVIDAETGKLYY